MEDGVGLDDAVAIRYAEISVLVEFANVDRGVVKVADGEGNGICGRWQETAAPAHKVLSEGDLCIETEVEASAPVSATRGPAGAPASGAWGVGVGAVVVARHCFWGHLDRLR